MNANFSVVVNVGSLRADAVIKKQRLERYIQLLFLFFSCFFFFALSSPLPRILHTQQFSFFFFLSFSFLFFFLFDFFLLNNFCIFFFLFHNKHTHTHTHTRARAGRSKSLRISMGARKRRIRINSPTAFTWYKQISTNSFVVFFHLLAPRTAYSFFPFFFFFFCSATSWIRKKSEIATSFFWSPVLARFQGRQTRPLQTDRANRLQLLAAQARNRTRARDLPNSEEDVKRPPQPKEHSMAAAKQNFLSVRLSRHKYTHAHIPNVLIFFFKSSLLFFCTPRAILNYNALMGISRRGSRLQCSQEKILHPMLMRRISRTTRTSKRS